jgi:hypothetical protein
VTYLIDLTDERFKISANADVINYIRRASPFAHSDLGQKLIDLNGELSLSSVYCPSFESCAYVILHDARNVIFAFAADMRDLSLRLPSSLYDEALMLGHGSASRVGGDWLDIAAFPRQGERAAGEAALAQYLIAAQRYTAALDPGAPLASFKSARRGPGAQPA